MSLSGGRGSRGRDLRIIFTKDHGRGLLPNDGGGTFFSLLHIEILRLKTCNASASISLVLLISGTFEAL